MKVLISIFGTVLTALVTGAIFAASHRGARRTSPTINENRYELRVNTLYAWIGWISTLIGVAPLFFIPFVEYQPSMNWSLPLMFLIFGPAGIYLVLSYYLHRLSYDGEGLKLTNWRGKTVSLAWSELEDIKYNASSGYLKIYARKEWHSVSASFVSLKSFLNKMKQKTRLKTSKLGLPF